MRRLFFVVAALTLSSCTERKPPECVALDYLVTHYTSSLPLFCLEHRKACFFTGVISSGGSVQCGPTTVYPYTSLLRPPRIRGVPTIFSSRDGIVLDLITVECGTGGGMKMFASEFPLRIPIEDEKKALVAVPPVPADRYKTWLETCR